MNEIISVADARKKIKGSKAIFVITDENDLADIKGYIDFVSEDQTTYDMMVQKFHKLGDDEIDAMLIGAYERSGASHVEYIL